MLLGQMAGEDAKGKYGGRLASSMGGKKKTVHAKGAKAQRSARGSAAFTPLV
jgi:hypothetical protein